MHRIVVSAGLALLLGIGSALAQSPAQQNTETDSDIAGSTVFGVAKLKPFRFLTFTLQNDLFVGDDSGYTNGFGITSGRGPFLEFSSENLPRHLNFLSKNLYIQTMPDKVRGVAHTVFQRMQTPEDITTPELQLDDVPYAGMLLLQSSLFAWDRNRSDELSLSWGFVGPITFAEQTQTRAHALINADRPEGWDNQIENEPVFRVQGRQTRKLYRNYTNRFGYDILALGAASLGTIKSDAQFGLAIRWGSNLEFSHATFNLQADLQVNSLALSPTNDFFVYLGAIFGLVANDILVDGNTFTESHSVPLDHTQDQISGGFVWKRNRLAYVFQVTSKSPGATVATRRETFGALSITYPFRN